MKKCFYNKKRTEDYKFSFEIVLENCEIPHKRMYNKEFKTKGLEKMNFWIEMLKVNGQMVSHLKECKLFNQEDLYFKSCGHKVAIHWYNKLQIIQQNCTMKKNILHHKIFKNCSK